MKLGARLFAAAAAAAALSGTSPARADDKFALGMFHFNIQYVAGGMVGYWATPNPAVDLDAEQIEDLIVTESFAPVLELYEKHPTWGVNIELQGYMLDVLAARHPDTLALLRTLAKSGQIEVVSFHYSDQLFIAHPRDDWSRSQELMVSTFAKHDIPLGKAVFCQEGQAGEIMAREMKDRGYGTMVWPKNLWTYQHGEFDAAPLYRFGDITMIAGAKGVNYQDGTTNIQVAWTFFDDGELLATNDMNPYFPDLFMKNEKALADYEAQVSGLEAQGFSITTVSKYVAAVSAQVTPAEPPPLLDGTWQPGSTDGVHRWLGAGGLWGADERDNDVRTLANLAHRELLAAETIAAEAKLDATATLADAWRLLALGEVSDATGINPFRGEAEYGIGHLTETLRIARGVIEDAKAALDLDEVAIDPASAKVTKGQADALTGTMIDAPMKLDVNGGDRMFTERWEQVKDGLARVEIAFDDAESRYLTVRFPGVMDDAIVTTRALDDTVPAAYARSAFTFEHFHLPLPIGMVGLGGGSYLIQDQARVHLAAQVFRDSGDVVFGDDTQTTGEPVTWVFYVLQGSAEDAVAFARALNDRRALSR
ncbi:Hypothetical protein A7982_04147 [Minicystis rosea]|nr:Hypothetical protein A7982_04147 [Minicystis rosea]